jgi:hypothetical protein
LVEGPAGFAWMAIFDIVDRNIAGSPGQQARQDDRARAPGLEVKPDILKTPYFVLSFVLIPDDDDASDTDAGPQASKAYSPLDMG